VGRWASGQVGRRAGGQMCRWADRQTGRRAGGQLDCRFTYEKTSRKSDRHADRYTHVCTGCQVVRDKQIHRRKDRQAEIYTNRQTGRNIYRQTDRQTGGSTLIQKDRQVGWRADGQAGRSRVREGQLQRHTHCTY
jgi:hypothetical protein